MTVPSNEWTGADLSGGRYLVTAKLGEGGMGSVYKAHDRNIEADVVVKGAVVARHRAPKFLYAGKMRSRCWRRPSCSFLPNWRIFTPSA